MKLLGVDWHAVFDVLPKWEALSVEQRRMLIDRRVADHGTRNADDRLIDDGWLQRVGSRSGPRFRVPRPRWFWLKLFRELSRAMPLPDEAESGRDAGAATLEHYLLQHYTAPEIDRIARRGPGVTRYGLARDMRRLDWWRQFLDWNGEAPASVFDPQRRWHEAPPSVVATARELIEAVVVHGGPVALIDLLEAAGDSSERDALAAGLDFAFREALLLIAADSAMMPFVCIWPPVLPRLQRGRATSPREGTFRGDELLSRPFLIEDISTVLLEAIAEPPRLKSGTYHLFVRNLRSIGSALSALPGWISPDLAPLSRERRAARAAHFAICLRMAAARGSSGTGRALVVTDNGRRWLTRPAKERLQQILDRLREDAVLVSGDSTGFVDPWYAVDPDAVPLDFVPYVEGLGWFFTSPSRGVVDAFRTVGQESVVDLHAFVHFHAEERNHLLQHGQVITYEQILDSERREEAERIWGSTLLTFFHERLLPLGGVALGPLTEGDAGFRMTDIGRYLLGEADDFDLDGPADTGDVIVQPNFEIVFLSPSPIDQVRARAFAAPTAALQGPKSVGTLFTIDRGSVQRAVTGGQEAEQVVAAAGELSKQPLPANVTRQIRDWAAEVRWIDIHPAVVVDCGDPDTAARVLAAVGKRGRLLSENVVELVQGTDLTPAMRRKLVSRGVFVRS